MLAPKDHWPLVKELKKLSLQEAIRLLRYCQSLYKMHGVAANVQLLKPHKGSRTPYLRCVVEWITALLDAHFAALVLAPECHALLKVSLSLALSLYLSLSLARELSLARLSLARSLSHTPSSLSLSCYFFSRARALSLLSSLSSLALSRSHTVSLFSSSFALSSLSLALSSLSLALSCSLLLSLSLSHSLTLCPLAHTHTGSQRHHKGRNSPGERNPQPQWASPTPPAQKAASCQADALLLRRESLLSSVVACWYVVPGSFLRPYIDGPLQVGEKRTTTSRGDVSSRGWVLQGGTAVASHSSNPPERGAKVLEVRGAVAGSLTCARRYWLKASIAADTG